MSIIAVPFAYFLAGAARRVRLRWLWVCGVLAVLLGTATFLVRHTWWDADDISTLRAGIGHDEGFDGTDEYDPTGDDHYNLPAKAPRVHTPPLTDPPGAAVEPKVYFDRWTAEEKDMRVTTPKPLQLAVRLLNYPAWRVQVNGKAIVPERAEDSGQMLLEIPAGQSQLSVRFTRTRDRTLGDLVSVVSLLAACFLAWWPVRT
jgi:hypothetical protein